MTEVLQSSPSHFSSPPSSTSSPCAHNDGSHPDFLISSSATGETRVEEIDLESEGGASGERKERDREGELSLVTLLIAAFRKSLIGCSVSGGKEFCSMEIGVPTNVRHVAHVTFDRFNGFLGLPVEFEPEVPRRAPSASTRVFGVSTESMQLSFDSRGNSVPTILLLMQRHLYARGGLQAEGIFRINAENSQEEYVRDQLNRGVVPNGIDVHCLAGLIKAWFRELPRGILDSLSPDQVMQSQSEEECARLVRLLPPTEAALLDWAINLMADVAQMEHFNKMNARNVAMVFAPNMTQMSDPLTALMYAVQVMNFLKMLIIKTLREREDSIIEPAPAPHLEPSDQNGHESSSQVNSTEETNSGDEEAAFVAEEPANEGKSQGLLMSIENIISSRNDCSIDNCPCLIVSQEGSVVSTKGKSKRDQTVSKLRKFSTKASERQMVCVAVESGKGMELVGRVNSRSEYFEAWR